jgi:hypothetical protein
MAAVEVEIEVDFATDCQSAISLWHDKILNFF